jgi:hypothetical protein
VGEQRRTEQVIVDALVETGTSPLEAVVATAAALGAITAALFEWVGDSGRTLGGIDWRLDGAQPVTVTVPTIDSCPGTVHTNW